MRSENIQSGHRNGIWHRKCVILVTKSGKQHLTDGIELPNQDKITALEEKETYKYLGIFKADTIKKVEMKEKIKKEYHRRRRKLLEAKLCSRKLIQGINTWAVTLVIYLGPFLKWTKKELQQIDQRRRKLKIMHKVLHPRDDVDKLYVLRKKAEKDETALKTALKHRYNNSKTTEKSVEKDLLQPPETILTTRRTTERRWRENKNGKKNNSMGVLNS